MPRPRIEDGHGIAARVADRLISTTQRDRDRDQHEAREQAGEEPPGSSDHGCFPDRGAGARFAFLRRKAARSDFIDQYT